jgi:hypothetical protein
MIGNGIGSTELLTQRLNAREIAIHQDEGAHQIRPPGQGWQVKEICYRAASYKRDCRCRHQTSTRGEFGR